MSQPETEFTEGYVGIKPETDEVVLDFTPLCDKLIALDIAAALKLAQDLCTCVALLVKRKTQ